MLITRTDVATYNQISKSIDDNLINNAIVESELLDLKPLLGELLYNDFVTNSANQKYLDLLNGKIYSYDGNDYTTQGIKPVLSKFSYARYIPFSGEKDTPFGLVNKNSQYSNQSEFSKKKAMAKLAQQTGYEYFKSVRDFLNRNSDIYPFWECGTSKRRFNFNKIGI